MNINTFNDFYKNTYKYFYNITYVITGHFDEDLLQDAYIKLYTSHKKFNPDKSALNTYFYLIIKSLYLTHIRDTRKIKFVDIQYLVDIYQQDEYEDKEPIINHMNNVINDLSTYDKELIQAYYDKTPYAKLAEKYNKPENTIKTHIHKIKGKLRKQLTTKANLA